MNIDANSEFYYSNVSPITTDFSVSPYYDKFDDTKNFYKYLMKPGNAVQARELNEIQSLLQDQIQKFGQHIFEEGSMVVGGKFTLDNRAHYVKVNDTDLLGDEVTDISLYENQVVTGQTTGIRAYVNLVIDGVETSQNTKTLYVSYLSGNPDTDEVFFSSNEPLVSNVGTLVVSNTSPVGYGTTFSVNEGVRFCKHFFVHHDKQTVVIDRYSINPTCKVGFYLEESIVTSDEDSSLLDPALEASNYSAPGADRFKIDPILTRLEYNDPATSPDFVTLFLIKDGTVTEIAERPVYNVIRDEIAKRTYDESGDYYVRGFNVVIEEHLDSGTNGGYLTLDRGGNSDLLSIQVEPGTAYVHGYEVNKLVTSFLEADKSTSYNNVNSQIISSKLGNYIRLNEVVGAWDLRSGQSIDLYDTAQQRISRAVSSTASQTGTRIGSAKVKSISYDDGSLGTPNGSIRLHLFDVNMLGSNSFANVRSVYSDVTTNADVGGDVILNSFDRAALSEPYSPLIYFVGSHTKTIRSSDGTVDTSFTFKKTSNVSINSDGTFTLTAAVGNEIFPYGTGTLSTADSRDLFLTLNDSLNIAIPGTAVSGNSSNSLLGSSTFFTRLNAGDKITISGNSSTFVIASITNNTSLLTTTNLPTTLSGNTFWKAYKSGDMVDFTAKGVDAGTTRSISSTPTSLTFDMEETLGTTVSGTISYTQAKTGAKEIKKLLKNDRYVTINCASHSATSNGPYDLGFSDIYKIKSIRKDTSDFTTSTQGTDVTSYFFIDKGQRDDFYTHGQILPSRSLGLTSSDKLLVCLDYFQPDFTLGVGYFSVDSYPVNDSNPTDSEITTSNIPVYKSPTFNFVADLRNCLDFRPVYTNTANDATTVATASINPANSTTLQYESSGLRLPADSESITFDYSYYLGRRDIVALNENGQFRVIKGVPSRNPVTPSCPPNLMSCAKLYIPPYPSLSPGNAKLTGRTDMGCSSARTSQIRFTMRDIGVIKQRVDNLENYVSLSLLEKSALDLKILDENGLDRFKNGIFVDSFTSFDLSDIGNRDHHICYDPKEGSIRPIFETQAIGYDLYSNTNIVQVGNMLMLPYTEVAIGTQPYATTKRNVETTVYRFVGSLYLDPDSDYWVNTERLASQTYSFGATDADITPYSVVYGSWQTTVTGVTTSDPVLISSSSSSTGQASSGAGTTVTYRGAYEIEQALKSLMAVYGGGGGSRLDGQITLKITNEDGVSYYPTIEEILTADSGYINPFYDSPISSFSIGNKDVMTVTITGGTSTTTSSNTYRTSVSTASQATRTFTETFQRLQTEVYGIGDKMISVAPIADIRPQVIAFEGRGLKASTRHYVFFDGQLMSSYVTPGTMLDVPSVLSSNTNSQLITGTGAEGSSLYSDSNGFVYGLLRVPSDSFKSFRTGTKQVVVTDSPTNEADATSACIAYFAAQGITQTIQEAIVSTSQVVTEIKDGIQKGAVTYSNTTNTYTTSNTTTSGTPGKVVINYNDQSSCMAYSFKFNTPEGIEGYYMPAVDVFFGDKDPNLGVWFEIRTMDNNGVISKIQVPDSEVWLDSSGVNTSDDGDTATTVRFKNPIFLLNNQEYAFIIHTVGINPNYYMYVSVLGQQDILTEQQVNERPLTGTLFTTNNNTDWDIVPRTDLKVTFYRCSFETDVTGEAIIGNQHREYIMLPLDARTASNTSWFGERVKGNDELNLSSPVGGTIIVGDLLIGTTSEANASVVSISGSRYKMSNTGFVTGEQVTAANANGSLYSITSNVVSINVATGSVYKTQFKSNTNQFQGNSTVIVIDNSNGLYDANDTLHYEFSGNTSAMTSITKFVYSTIQFEPSYLDFLTTEIDFSMSMISNTGTTTEYQGIALSTPVDFDEEMAVYSRSTEIATYSSNPSNKVKVEMSTTSNFLSPQFNLKRTYNVYIHNLINSNTSGELASSGGGLKNKYISQVITLAEGQDAEDLRVILTAYRPPSSNSDIKVYVRFTNSEDFESIYERNWIEMESFDTLSYSSLANRKDFREFNYKIPDDYLTGINDQEIGVYQYTNGANTQFTGYKQFQVKIGLQSDTSAIYPRAADLRAIAVQL